MSSRDRALADFLPERSLYSFDLLLGRLLAFCVHPVAAWRVLTPFWRFAILTIYAAAGFLIVLTALLLTV
jgi:hypothetical protein